MGLDITQTEFSTAEHQAFAVRLEQNLQRLQALMAEPGFGAGEASIGAELELYLVDENGRPLCINNEVHALAADPQLTLELNRYNLEYNLTPQACAGQPFRALEAEMSGQLARLSGLAGQCGGSVVPIGILPTLQHTDFGAHCITDKARYHALVKQLIRRRGSDFFIDINGADPLRMAKEDITLEGANTSFQLHYRVTPQEFASTFNAIQLATPLVLAVAANSPTLFGHRLWHETRIPLFKQSIDTRHRDRYRWNPPARVNFGHGWLRRGALELFREAVRLYPPLLPVVAESGGDGDVSLAELRLHQSTVWLWNRPVYDDAGGGHLRIEMRALPAGPSAIDMAANAALLIGLAEGLKGSMDELLPAMPFSFAEYNFYRAAQYGLDARLVWPRRDQQACEEASAAQLLTEMLPLAREGLATIGIAAEESDYYLNVITERLARRQTGASWQLQQLAAAPELTPDALARMLERYMQYSQSNLPIAQWPGAAI
jgi:gamma-glutamyl:cysteine ligase YbdK (ATP-grasp superfamily)